APGFQQGHGGFDNGALAVSQHVKHLSRADLAGKPTMGTTSIGHTGLALQAMCQSLCPAVSSTYRQPCLFDARQLQSI
ncbi:hypothetical protein, partial [Comamonas aquatica]|uniref:hypothetical protein n=1 Tax=Comamonas aquatica TaxID=225991 RepID=UPI0028D2A4EF